MSKIFFAPVYSLYSLSFYRGVLKSSLARGFLYLCYLAAIAAFIVTVAFSSRMLPKADQFVIWLKGAFPEIRFTPQGVQTSVAEPYHLKHPVLGNIMTVDTRVEMPTKDEMSETVIFLTKTKMIVRERNRGQYKIYDLVGNQKSAGRRDFTVTGALIQKAYQKVVPFIFPFIFFTTGIVVFFWKCLAAIFYSLLGVVLNIFRREKLPYEKILNCACFSLTAVFILQLVGAVASKRLPLNLWTASFVTLIYLGIGILLTQQDEQTGIQV